MAVNVYDGFTNQIARETFRCLSYNKEAFTIEWLVEPEGYVPFEHIHLNQDEIFHIKKGEMRILIEGKEHIVPAGESIIVPKGTPHIAYNNKPERLESIVEYKPGLDNYKFFQCFGGLLIDGDTSKNGTVNIPKMCYFTKKMNAQSITRPTSIPAPIFKIAIHISYIIGSIVGWKKLYFKYTGDH
ncbi:MAG: cupin domain-containing protein [Saprospiraceae bacterium]|jgi:mannose-6-phosphate isomerase-like protein (cupin superfamily)|nr:cupin domain-containing protein [Saprospiraceae bacterium]MCI1267432.1 cupin domain-containing protein [Saprospiraceae bacterium]